jgi:hypothetical protein
MSIKIQGSTIIDDSRNIVNAGITTTAILNVGVGGTIITTTETGFVGIGTTNPTTNFQVVGNTLITGITTISTLNVESNISGAALESYELDDISSGTNGQENTFIPTFNYDRVTITNPFSLMVTVNGVPQSAFINNTDYVYQSNFLGSNSGFTIDTDNNIKFTESIPTGSDVVARVLPVSNTATKIRLYPFKPTDILLGY